MGSLKAVLCRIWCAILIALFLSLEFVMKPLSRGRVSKVRSARRFRAQVGRTKAPNVARVPMRGGWRL